MRKSTLWLAVFLLVSLSQAHATFNGWYAGIHGGLSCLSGKHEFTNNGALAGNDKHSDNAGLGGVHAGIMYEIGMTQFIIGLEGFFSQYFGDVKKNLNTFGGAVIGTVKVRHQNAAGFALLLGRAVNPKVKFYFRIGCEWHKFKFNYVVAPPGGVAVQTTISETSRRLVPGYGFKYRLSKSIGIGFEHLFFLRNRVKPSVNATLGAVLPFVQYKPQEQRFIIKLSWIFHPHHDLSEDPYQQ